MRADQGEQARTGVHRSEIDGARAVPAAAGGLNAGAVSHVVVERRGSDRNQAVGESNAAAPPSTSVWRQFVRRPNSHPASPPPGAGDIQDQRKRRGSNLRVGPGRGLCRSSPRPPLQGSTTRPSGQRPTRTIDATHTHLRPPAQTCGFNPALSAKAPEADAARRQRPRRASVSSGLAGSRPPQQLENETALRRVHICTYRWRAPGSP